MIVKFTSEFILRDMKFEDKEDYIRNINNKNVLKYMGGEYPYNPQKFDKMIELRDKEPNSHFCFVIEIKNEVVGEIGLNRIERKISNHIATIGYWLAEKYWGQGIMTKAVAFACDYAFNKLNFEKITTEIFSENVGSQKILEKNNFISEGLLKKHAFKNSQYYDIMCYSKFNN